jgi:hypothetical protein
MEVRAKPRPLKRPWPNSFEAAQRATSTRFFSSSASTPRVGDLLKLTLGDVVDSKGHVKTGFFSRRAKPAKRGDAS